MKKHEKIISFQDATFIKNRCMRFRGGVLLRLLRLSSPYMPRTLLSLIFSLLHAAAALFIPIFIGRAIDGIIETGSVNFDEVFRYIIYIMICIAVSSGTQYLAAVLVTSSAHSTVRDLRIALFAKLNVVPVSFMDTTAGGDIMARMSADTEQIADGLIHGTTNLFSGIFTVIGTLALMFSINWEIALTVTILTPLSIFISYFIARSCRNKFMEQAALRGRLSGIAEEYVGSQKLVLAFGYGETAKQKFSKVNGELKKTSIGAAFFSSLTNPSARLINGIVYAAAVTMGAIFIANGLTSLTKGLLTTILLYANQYARPFNEITAVITELQTAFAGAKRVFEILDKPEIESDVGLPDLIMQPTETQNKNNTGGRGNCVNWAPPSPCVIDRPSSVCASPPSPCVIDTLAADQVQNSSEMQKECAAVEIRELDFSYTDTPLIANFNLSVLAGQRVAIVGPTGSGKTTVINLLMRFYEPDAGSICVDGTDIRSVTRRSLRACYGMVLQESWLFEGTVRENIAYSKPHATDEEIIAAAKNADIHNFIMRLENGYDTVIQEGGGNISLGQMQLMCIARIMLSLPPMLILDEATSSIDTRTEAIIQSAFSKMMQGRTSFIIAHRLSTIKEADMILVLNGGKIIEQGTHTELLAAKGFYHNLYNSQFEN